VIRAVALALFVAGCLPQRPGAPEAEPEPVAAPKAPAGSLVELESQIIIATNRLRENPRAFAAELERYRGFIDGNLVRFPDRERPVIAHEGVAAVDEAIAAIRRVEPLPRLAVSGGLTHAAREHAVDVGRHGHIDHVGSDGSQPHERMARHGRLVGYSAENINTRHRRGLWAVIDLFVDDGVASRGHRLALIGSDYRYIGVGCAPHVKWEVVCVMDLAEGYRDR
jgi:uncharacterized protein YkwD